MQLEQLRENDIGKTFAWVPSRGKGQDSTASLTYLHFTQLAFYYSAQQIEQLEFSTSQINQGNAAQTAVGVWFISIEAYVNSILRVACIVKHLSFDKLKSNDLGKRIKTLFDILEIERHPFYSQTLQKLEEFKRYRNELFHDRTNDKSIKFHKTAFSGNPLYANQVDVMQACVIALEVFQSFRFVIPRLDLMPQIMITKEDSFFFKKLDQLYNEVLNPYFTSALSKHLLTTSVDLNISATELEESNIFSNIAVEIIINAVPDVKFEKIPSSEKTQIGQNLFDLVRSKVNLDTKENFLIGNFYQ